MLINRSEYQKMFESEQTHWWYKTLHNKVLKAIRDEFAEDKSISILDAGCGTGGMLEILKLEGYTNIQGFDFSEDAVEFCSFRDIKVNKRNILDLKEDKKLGLFHVVICNDVLYQFEDAEIETSLNALMSKVVHEGLLISNNQAFEVLSGIHDIAVGAKRRFVLKDFYRLICKMEKIPQIKQSVYWSLLLSPLIFFIRLFQRLKLRSFNVDSVKIKSDVNLPSPILNKLLYYISDWENRFIPSTIFGSSLFLVLKK